MTALPRSFRRRLALPSVKKLARRGASLFACISTIPLGAAGSQQRTPPAEPFPGAQARRTTASALEDVTLIDGTGREAMPHRTILIRDERIADIFPTGSKPLPPGTRVQRLSGMFVMPGLVDAHVHLTYPFTTRSGQESILALLFRSGVTTVRDMAGDAVALTALQRQASDAAVQWPRIHYSAVMAGPGFMASDRRTVPVSHGVQPGPSPWLRAVTDTTNLVLAVEVAKWTGATGVKLYADLPADLVARITAEAHRQGMKVWSHAAIIPSRPGDAVRAGVDVISHADILVAEGIARMPASFATFGSARQYTTVQPSDSSIIRLFREMRAAGTMLEPTLLTSQRIAAAARSNPDREALWYVDKWSYDVTRHAHEMGVMLVSGTDLMGTPGRDSVSLIHDELELLVRESGVAPLHAIRTATLNGALAIGIASDHGTVEVGKVADLVVLRASPLMDIRNTRSVAFVVKGGVSFER
ncbi:MAG: amidohydrolase family protein [Gemmatimonadaceae bacterium]